MIKHNSNGDFKISRMAVDGESLCGAEERVKGREGGRRMVRRVWRRGGGAHAHFGMMWDKAA